MVAQLSDEEGVTGENWRAWKIVMQSILYGQGLLGLVLKREHYDERRAWENPRYERRACFNSSLSSRSTTCTPSLVTYGAVSAPTRI